MKVVLAENEGGARWSGRSTVEDDGIEGPVDLLILGAGWTAGFLIQYVTEHEKGFRWRATTTSGGGRYGAIKFKYDPSQPTTALAPEEDARECNQFARLPDARAILISFPITLPGASSRLLHSYLRSRPESSLQSVQFLDVIQLGSSGIFLDGPTQASGEGKRQEKTVWIDRHSAYDTENARARSEDELLVENMRGEEEGVRFRTTVLNLAGLWGGTRSMRNYVERVVGTKAVLREKTSLHMIHGLDVARAILAVLRRFGSDAAGQRWLLSDMRVYDWWDLAAAWGQAGLVDPIPDHPIGPQAHWVNQLLQEHNIRALPRPPEALGRAIDSREFWRTFQLSPVRARLEHFS